MPRPGDIVYYTLTVEDTLAINARRFLQASGRQGAPPAHGDTCPAMVICCNPDGTHNLQIFLNGNDTHWAENTHNGQTPGTWTHRD